MKRLSAVDQVDGRVAGSGVQKSPVQMLVSAVSATVSMPGRVTLLESGNQVVAAVMVSSDEGRSSGANPDGGRQPLPTACTVTRKPTSWSRAMVAGSGRRSGVVAEIDGAPTIVELEAGHLHRRQAVVAHHHHEGDERGVGVPFGAVTAHVRRIDRRAHDARLPREHEHGGDQSTPNQRRRTAVRVGGVATTTSFARRVSSSRSLTFACIGVMVS